MIGLARSSFYFHPEREARPKVILDEDIQDEIDRIHAMFPSYGYRRIQECFIRTGLTINHKRIRRVMREKGLFPIVWQSFKVSTTDSKHSHRIYPNLLKDRKVDGINQVWASDLTYIRIVTCFVYLAVILDIYSRKVIGWAISKSLDRSICLTALKMAIEDRHPSPGCVHHSDRGVQYTCDEYIQDLCHSGFQISMSRKGNCWDNAFVESFFKTLKQEEVHLNNYEIYEEVLENLPSFIEHVYNKKRFHSSLGYLSPVEFESLYAEKGTENYALRPVLKLW